MAVQTKPITASQFASAITHLERRSEWRTVRIDNVRYISLVSGRSNRVYLARADADGCSCIWSQTMSSPCSHRIAIDLDALEQELAEAPIMADLFTRCARVGCTELCEGTTLCDACSALQERAERMAAARRRVVEEWI